LLRRLRAHCPAVLPTSDGSEAAALAKEKVRSVADLLTACSADNTLRRQSLDVF
jgi:hypothetical protein